MQGVGSNNDGLLVLGATNLPWEIDPAVRRRFEKRIYISLPDIESRVAIIKYSLGKTPCNCTETDFREIGESTEGFSGSDISTLCKDAIMAPVRKC
jgi:vacuolar protein-sorting-associated protein 4